MTIILASLKANDPRYRTDPALPLAGWPPIFYCLQLIPLIPLIPLTPPPVGRRQAPVVSLGHPTEPTSPHCKNCSTISLPIYALPAVRPPPPCRSSYTSKGSRSLAKNCILVGCYLCSCCSCSCSSSSHVSDVPVHLVPCTEIFQRLNTPHSGLPFASHHQPCLW